MDLSNKRQEYELGSIDLESVAPSPYKQFEEWFTETCNRKVLEPNAMTLSTVNPEGRPTQRTVLLKYFDESGFVFFTNYESRKAQHISNNGFASLLFPWVGLQRQIEISGHAEKVSTAESMKYFALRPRGSQLGAWVSQQSSVISARSILANKLAELTEKFSSGDVPMPSAWGGFRIKPDRFEFWQGRPNRLHDRIEYNLEDSGNWSRRRLCP